MLAKYHSNFFVFAGDIYNITHLRTWEFEGEGPLRDITLPYLFYAPALYLLRAALHSTHLAPYIAESYAVVALPRILLVLAGIVNWFAVKGLCREFSVDQGLAGWYWWMSYATWVFLTRPFSNTMETLLLSAVTLLVLSLAQGCRGVRHGTTASPGTQNSQATGKAGPALADSFLLGSVVCMGVMNRPTFCVFILVPLVWWVEQLVSTTVKKGRQMVAVILTGAGGFFTFILLSLGNSLYYNPEFGHLLKDLYTSLAQGDVEMILRAMEAVVSGVRVPAWNFLRYNLLAVNVAEHGLHPWYTHMLVSLPVLLGPAALLLAWDVGRLLRHCRLRQDMDVLYAAVVFPVVCLSLVPHQEARFLLPVLPLAVVCVARNGVAGWKTFRAAFVLFNVLGFVVFGWLHQGGVVPALSSLQGRMKSLPAEESGHDVRYHVFAYNTYMPPRHLLFVDDRKMDLHVDDMIGAHGHPPTLQYRLDRQQSACVHDSVRCVFFLLLPSTAVQDVELLQRWEVREEGEFCPHLTMERLPVVGQVKGVEDIYNVVSQLCLKVLSLTP